MMGSEGLRIIVCGGRDYRDAPRIEETLTEIEMTRGSIYAVIHGNASGADTFAGAWARRHKIREWPVPAEWAKFGNSAGPRRNKNMLGMSPDLVVAFPGGKGTRNMVKQAQTAGVEVIEVAAHQALKDKP